MTDNLRTRFAVVLVVLAATIVWTTPNFIDFGKIWWPSTDKLAYGLDIQGGLHLVLGIDDRQAVDAHLKKLASNIKTYLSKEKSITIENIEITDTSLGKMRLTYASPSAQQVVRDYIEDTSLGQGNVFQVLESTSTFIEVRFYESYFRRFQTSLAERTIETIRNRIDEFGVKEPTIVAQGGNRILVQLPGVQDSTQAKELISKTAKLEFMIIDPEYNPYEKPEQVEALQAMIKEAEIQGNFGLGKDDLRYSAYVQKLNEVLKDKLPKNRAIRFGMAPDAKTLEAGKVPFLLQTDAAMTGESLNDAHMTLGQMGEPIVAFSFDPKGAKEFGELTTTHVQKLMAVVLDGVVKTYPRLKSPITGGSGIIELGSGGDRQALIDEANMISMVLRSGSLPAELEQLEERTVGPTLGRDSIDKGKFASLLAGALVFAFMVFWYKSYGLIANLALIFNVLMTLAILTSLQATLTLPGVAGIALTIGMAVDANIIIFERIKEEIARGSSVAAAIKEGYARAFWAIFDSNITTAGVCVVLMYFGTGPIRGFAVTLICGLATSMFTAIFFTRTILNYLVGKLKLNFAP